MPNEQDPSKQGQGGDASADKQYLTKESLADALKDLLPEAMRGSLNAAITSHTKRLEKSFEERLAKLAPKPVEGEGEEVVEGQGDVAKAKAEAAAKAKADAGQQAKVVDPEVAELKKSLAKLQAKAEKAEKDALAERRQRIEEAGIATVRKALAGKVVAGAEDDLVDLLRARNQLVIADDGAVRLRLGGKDEPEEGHDLTEGVTAFLKTDRAKLYLPAPNSGAAGGKKPAFSSAGGSRAGATTDLDEAFRQKTGKSLGEALSG